MIKQQIPDIRLLYSEDERITTNPLILIMFEAVSKYPPILRDISFIVNKDFDLNAYYELIHEVPEQESVEEVKLLDLMKRRKIWER